MELIQKIKGILTTPSKFFENLKKEKGLKKAFIYFMILSLFSFILTLIIQYFSNPLYLNLFGGSLSSYTFWLLLILIVIFYGLVLIFSFIMAALLHLWIIIFGGKANYEKTYQLYIYSHTPNLVFGWIPIINLLIWIYSLVLLIIGTQKVHKIPKTRAILMYVIPFILIIVLLLILILFLSSILKTTPISFLRGY